MKEISVERLRDALRPFAKCQVDWKGFGYYQANDCFGRNANYPSSPDYEPSLCPGCVASAALSAVPTDAEVEIEPPRVRTAEERAALTIPSTHPVEAPWVDRAMTREHVEKLRHGHLCHGYDCKICVWVATLDSLVAAALKQGEGA